MDDGSGDEEEKVDSDRSMGDDDSKEGDEDKKKKDEPEVGKLIPVDTHMDLANKHNVQLTQNAVSYF